MDAITLVQTKEITPLPIVLVGSDFWGRLMAWIKDSMLTSGQDLPAGPAPDPPHRRSSPPPTSAAHDSLRAPARLPHRTGPRQLGERDPARG
ncbi:hypothetical protein [Thermomonospora umbrina]|uniref:hypothetical protein n=1 Tax=Thermomonospora umbrina TaxID=111806 RepID=UPI001FE88AA9|nr:hypothetical protein [Thermomonospora umbrina]